MKSGSSIHIYAKHCNQWALFRFGGEFHKLTFFVCDGWSIGFGAWVCCIWCLANAVSKSLWLFVRPISFTSAYESRHVLGDPAARACGQAHKSTKGVAGRPLRLYCRWSNNRARAPRLVVLVALVALVALVSVVAFPSVFSHTPLWFIAPSALCFMLSLILVLKFSAAFRWGLSILFRRCASIDRIMVLRLVCFRVFFVGSRL